MDAAAKLTAKAQVTVPKVVREARSVSMRAPRFCFTSRVTGRAWR
jgi:hypothetical protein